MRGEEASSGPPAAHADGARGHVYGSIVEPPETPTDALRRYFELTGSKQDRSHLVTGAKAKEQALLGPAVVRGPDRADVRDRVHLIDIGPARVDGDRATVEFHALAETTVPSPSPDERDFVAVSELSGPATLRMVEHRWAIDDYATDGITVREALRLATGGVMDGGIRAEPVAAVLRLDRTVFVVRVLNDTDAAISLAIPSVRIPLRRRLAGGGLPIPGDDAAHEQAAVPRWLLTELRAHRQVVPAGAEGRFAWAYGSSPLLAETKRLTLHQNFAREDEPGQSVLKIPIRLSPFPEELLSDPTAPW
jgi:hypothetical protein